MIISSISLQRNFCLRLIFILVSLGASSQYIICRQMLRNKQREIWPSVGYFRDVHFSNMLTKNFFFRESDLRFVIARGFLSVYIICPEKLKNRKLENWTYALI